MHTHVHTYIHIYILLSRARGLGTFIFDFLMKLCVAWYHYRPKRLIMMIDVFCVDDATKGSSCFKLRTAQTAIAMQ